MKVMHIVHDLDYGGAQKMFVKTSEGLQRRGNTENVCCIITDKKVLNSDIYGIKKITLNLPHITSFANSIMATMFELPLLFWAVYNEKPDVLYTYYGPMDQLFSSIIGKILGKKTVTRKYGQEHIRSSFNRCVCKLNYMLTDRIVTIFTEGIAELSDIGISKEKITYIPNGRYATKKTKSKNIAGIDKTDFVIGTVSRLTPIKNHVAVIDAISKMKNKNIKFVIIGEGNYKKKLERTIKHKKLEENIIFIGATENIMEIISGFDVFVHPSFAEGCPNAVLEAMSCGLPVIASDVGGHRDLLGDGTGVLVEPKDTKKLREWFEIFLENPELRKEYGKKAKEKIKNEFSLDIMLRKYEKLFEGL